MAACRMAAIFIYINFQFIILTNCMKNAVLFSLVVFSAGCASPSRQPGIKLVGNMSLVAVASKYDQSYQLVMQNGSFSGLLLNDYVVETFGNDSILIAKCIGQKGNFGYFKIMHFKGRQAAPSQQIPVAEYNQIRNGASITFNFTDDARYNWK
jgi:hypothetical protein